MTSSSCGSCRNCNILLAPITCCFPTESSWLSRLSLYVCICVVYSTVCPVCDRECQSDLLASDSLHTGFVEILDRRAPIWALWRLPLLQRAEQPEAPHHREEGRDQQREERPEAAREGGGGKGGMVSTNVMLEWLGREGEGPLYLQAVAGQRQLHVGLVVACVDHILIIGSIKRCQLPPASDEGFVRMPWVCVCKWCVGGDAWVGVGVGVSG